MSDVKTIEKWERVKGVLFSDTSNLDKEVTEEEFDQLIDKRTGYTYVNHEDREQFLRSNGYKVTRKNMIDPELSHKGQDSNEPNA
jgi:hypothetical protein